MVVPSAWQLPPPHPPRAPGRCGHLGGQLRPAAFSSSGAPSRLRWWSNHPAPRAAPPCCHTAAAAACAAAAAAVPDDAPASAAAAAMETPTVVSRTKGHGCSITQYAYQSPALGGTRAVFSVIAPPAPAGEGGDGRPPLPALYWLSGLTCTDQNFITKSGAAAHVATAGLLIVAPDTSPRGAGAPGEDDGWDFGTGAGWYLDATAPGFGAYQMETYIVNELPAAVAAALAADDGAGGAGGGVALDPARRSVAGHSMGGHGALTLAARHPGTYASASAFAPVAHPTACPWGVKAFTGYLGKPPAGDGPPPAAWAAHDATELMAARTSPLLPDVEVRVDQGAADEFWAAGQLRGDEYVAACKRVGQAAAFHLHDGYDHSYHFVATFLGDHVKLHAAALGANK